MKNTNFLKLLIFIIILGLNFSGFAQMPTTGLISHYSFESTANGCEDEIQNHDGTVNNITVNSSGRVNNCYSFNGTNSFIAVPSFNRPSTGLTMSVWVNMAIPSSYQHIIGAEGNGGDSWQFKIRTDGRIRVLIWDTAYNSMTGISSITANAWTHMAVTYDGTNTIFYRNGIADGTSNAMSGDIGGNTTDGIEIGRELGGGQEFNGLMDEVRIYDRALSSAEISTLAGEIASAPTALEGGEIFLGTTAIDSATAPAQITSTSLASGGSCGTTYSYIWQSSTGGSYTDITGAENTYFQPPVLHQNTSYRRKVTCNSVDEYSNVISITINPTSGGGSGNDPYAIHTNQAGEISGMSNEKTTVVGADLIVIEDSENQYAKRKVQISNLPGGAIDGTESIFNGWDKNSSDDFDGNYNSLSSRPTIPTVSVDAYNANNWDGNDDAATKNAIRDKIESIVSGNSDDWGDDVVNTNNTLLGNGTPGSLLEVNTSIIATQNDLANLVIDDDATNEIQSLSISGNELSISNGNSVSLPSSSSSSGEIQTLTINGNDLTISDGNTVALPSGSGNWDLNQSTSAISYTNGSVGIGTSSPQQILHVKGTSRFTGFNDSHLELSSWDLSGADNICFNANNSSHTAHVPMSFAASKFYFYTGNVGIGTSDPGAYKLNVAGSMFANDIFSDKIGIGTTNLGSYELNVAGSMFSNNIYSDKLGIGTTVLGSYELNVAGSMFSNTIYSDKIGIGTTDTQGYDFAVAGTMVAEEITVKLQATWPDFVFERNHEMLNLDELENFIKINKHLPGIPTESEVKESGINLAEMNAKLLQKVEELTLYIIQLKKETDTIKLKLK